MVNIHAHTKVKIDAGRQGTIEKHMNLDTGATLNCISQAAYNREFAWLKSTVGTPVKLAPLEIGMFNKGHSVIITMMQGVTLRIGCSLYCLDFMVVPDAQYDNLLGAPFMSAFAEKPNFRIEYAEIGCPTSADGRPIPAFQKVPMYFRARTSFWTSRAPNNTCRRRISALRANTVNLRTLLILLLKSNTND